MAVVLVVAFLVVPILEIYVIIQVGQVIGAWPTVALLIIESLLGGWLVRREGRRAWRALHETVHAGRLPSRQLADGALVLVGGTLLLTPGFVTDVAGFTLVLPPTRALVRRLLLARLARRVLLMGGPGPMPYVGPTGGRWAHPPGAGGRVVPGEVVDRDE